MGKINPAEIIGRECGIQPDKQHCIAEVESIPDSKHLPPPDFGHREIIETVYIQTDVNGKPIGIVPVRVYLQKIS